jgi:hypothetical protein
MPAGCTLGDADTGADDGHRPTAPASMEACILIPVLACVPLRHRFIRARKPISFDGPNEKARSMAGREGGSGLRRSAVCSLRPGRLRSVCGAHQADCDRVAVCDRPTPKVSVKGRQDGRWSPARHTSGGPTPARRVPAAPWVGDDRKVLMPTRITCRAN